MGYFQLNLILTHYTILGGDFLVTKALFGSVQGLLIHLDSVLEYMPALCITCKGKVMCCLTNV